MKDKKSFYDILNCLIKDKGRALLIALCVLVGVVLLIIGGASGTSEQAADTVEERLEELCSSLSGVGQCRVMVTYKEKEMGYGKQAERTVESVAIVCKGADRASVRSELTSLLSSLFGIGTNRIHISKMK
ncbi:MAG: hypothetical protein IKC32_01665 [Clostridia bacterium]|nr:hypothetical protein [Clostridia bacterium]